MLDCCFEFALHDLIELILKDKHFIVDDVIGLVGFLSEPISTLDSGFFDKFVHA